MLSLARTATEIEQATGPVLDACFAEAGSTSVVSGGLSKAVTRHDLMTGGEDVVGVHDAAVKCVEYDEDTAGSSHPTHTHPTQTLVSLASFTRLSHLSHIPPPMFGR